MLILAHHEFLLYWDVANPLVGRLAKVHMPKADWATSGDLAFYRW